MIVVDGGGVGDLVYVGVYELENGYLGSGILVSNVVRVEFEVRFVMFNVLVMWIV